MQGNGQVLAGHNPEPETKLDLQNPTESQRFQSHLQLQLNQISHPIQEPPHNNVAKFQNAFSERDFDFVSIAFLSCSHFFNFQSLIFVNTIMAIFSCIHKGFLS